MDRSGFGLVEEWSAEDARCWRADVKVRAGVCVVAYTRVIDRAARLVLRCRLPIAAGPPTVLPLAPILLGILLHTYLYM